MTSTALSKDKGLGVIQITSVKDIEMVEMQLDVDDDVFKELVEWGREDIVKDERACFEYAFRKGPEEGIKRMQEREHEEKHS